MTFSLFEKFGWNPSANFTKIKEGEISLVEYNKLCEKHGIFDSEEFSEKIKKSNGIRERLSKSTPLCSKCKLKMLQKDGPYGHFLGCPKYPKCKQTKKIEHREKKEIAQLMEELSQLKNFLEN